ncbi:MAG: LacI family DNA-binding transcriptional regulator [Anaerolineaceae bacterium]|nr:LacI family DNA-binding transcriptional regulator [Anaerolineaceae bacterium]
MDKKNPTIRDVAKLAGVSHQTVSRVINDSERVLPATREKVLNAIETLGYQPSAIARSMAYGRTSTIAFVAPNLTDYTFANIISAAEKRLRDLGYYLIITTADDEESYDHVVEHIIQRGRVDGLIVHATHLQRDRNHVLETLPTVFVGVSVFNNQAISTVFHDNYAISRIAVDHLYQLGHRRIGMVLGPEIEDCVSDRTRSFYEAMRAHKLKIDPALIVNGDWSESSGYEAFKRMFRSENPPTAVYAQNDRMATGVLHAAREHGLRVPEDFSVIGVDDVPQAQHFYPSLTTVRQFFANQGTWAANLLLGLLKEPGGHQHICLPVELVVRESTGLAPSPKRDSF